MARYPKPIAPSNVSPISGGASQGDGQGLTNALGKAADLSDEQRLFLEWLTGGRQDGESQARFAERIGVPDYQLSKWKRLPSFLAAWEERMLRTHASPAILSEQLATVREVAANGRSERDRLEAVKLYWALLEKMTPVGQQVVRAPSEEHRDAVDLSDEELDKLLGAS